LTNLELEKKISTAFDDIAPDNFDRIYADFQQKQKIRRKKNLYKSIISIAAVFVVVITAVISFDMVKQYNTVDSMIYFDINPSIVLEVNKSEKVLSAQAENKDAKKVLEGLKLKGEDLSEAVDVVINAVVKKGYINKKSNSVLVSVDNKDSKKGEELQKKLSEKVSKTLQKDGVEGAILSQALDKTPETKKLADEHSISEGKTQLINEILKVKEDYTFEALANLSINELNLLCDSGKDIKGHIDANGIASDERYIGKEKAKEIVFNAINIAEEDMVNYECNLILEKGKMLYAITFVVKMRGQQIDIDAINGDVIRNSMAIEEEKEPEEEDNITDLPEEEKDNNKSEDEGGKNTPEDGDDKNTSEGEEDTNKSEEEGESKNQTEENEPPKLISAKRAKNIAYEHARVIDKKKKSKGITYYPSEDAYKFSFTCEGYYYHYVIKGKTGKIVKNKKYVDNYKLLENVSEKKAKKNVCSHLGIEEAQAQEIKIVLNDEKMEYQLSFQYDKYKYVYTVNSKTGIIANISKELTESAIAEGLTEVEPIDEADAKRIVFDSLNVTEDEVLNYKFKISQGTADESIQVYYISFKTPKYYSCQFDLDMKTGLILYSEVEDA